MRTNSGTHMYVYILEGTHTRYTLKVLRQKKGIIFYDYD